MASLTGETMVFTTAPQPDGWKKEEDESLVLESLKKELKTKHREACMVQRNMRAKMLEWHKIHFKRAMEKALLTNSIIKERSLLMRHTTPDYSAHRLLLKTQDFNQKIKCAIFVGLDGILFGPPSNKRKRPSSDGKELEVEEAEKELEEELEDLKKHNKAILVQIVPEEDLKKVEGYCKNAYKRARPFAKLESREEGLKCIVNSLLEREAREIVFRPTENELLGYMLLKEMANSTLQYPHILFPPNNKSLELPNCTPPPPPPSSSVVDEEKIVVGLNSRLFGDPGDDGSDYYSALKLAKSAANKSDEIKMIKEFISMLEVVIEKGTRVAERFF